MKQIYNMIDGIPIWQHLKNGAEETKVKLIAADYGKFAEILGGRILHKLTEMGGILEDIFPGIDIVSVQTSPRMTILYRKKIEIGDLVLEISCKDSCSGTFGKKIVIFEIKHGRAPIEQNQLRRYCLMVNNPEEYFPKADEVKVIFLMFSDINTKKSSASYSICELSKILARRILENCPTNTENVATGNAQNQNIVDIDISCGLKMIIEDL